MPDLTVIYLTNNYLPVRWVAFQLDHLRRSTKGYPLISISRQPMDLGVNLLQTEPSSYWNIYMQLLRGARLAETPFIALAEDDVLYTPEHFHEFRPPAESVSYDRSRWSLFTWDTLYCVRQRVCNCTLIAPRDLVISVLEEWQAVWPSGAPEDRVGEIGRPIVERRMHVTAHQSVEWYCTNPVVQLNHPTATHGDPSQTRDANGRKMVKKHGQIKAYDIPYWGKATDVLAYYLRDEPGDPASLQV